MKILIFYASYGGGHLSAARSIQDYFNDNYSEHTTKLVDCMKYVNKPFEKEGELTEALEKQKDITYRYEHFGESKNTERAETEETEGAETVRYSKQSVESTSEEENRWVAERVESVEQNKGKKNNAVNIGDIVKTIRGGEIKYEI